LKIVFLRRTNMDASSPNLLISRIAFVHLFSAI
jgi:hypothetical protein